MISQASETSVCAKRLLIVGLDGATFDVLKPLMREGAMPRLAEAIDGGVHGILQSTTPAITPAAWTTFLTGRQPGAHGILDFERYEPTLNRLHFNTTHTHSHVRNLWRILSDRGLRVGSINVPMTYPAYPVNGFLISGFETPGVNSDFVYPAELKADILARWPDPTLRAKWRRRPLQPQRAFTQNLHYIRESFQQGVEMTRRLGDRFGWDVLMVVLKLVDNLQHKTWKYIDPRWAERSSRRSTLVREVFRELDRAVGDFLTYARAHNAAVLMVSDHGHGSLEGKVHPNQLLLDWGYMTLRSGGAQEKTSIRRAWDRFVGRTRKFARAGDVAHDLAVDFTRTRVCVMHAGMAGFLYVNLQGRQPCGIVPQESYEALRDELIQRFLSQECIARDPYGKTLPLFEAVHKPEELYRCTREAQPWMPDLILIPRRSLAVVRRIRGGSAVTWLSENRIEGTHRPEGILVANGPGIAVGREVNAHIVDCLPTILAFLGLPIPNDLDGEVITEMFAAPPNYTKESGVAAAAKRETRSEGYTEQELQKVTERLSDLGYLE